MLIIFDLDDTLIQTSEKITPWRFQKVLSFLLQNEPVLNEKKHIINELICNHHRHESSKNALIEFFKDANLDSKHFETSCAMLNEYDETIPVQVFEGVYSLLNKLKLQGKLFCVTAGDPLIQNLKLKKAQLDQNFFEKIFVVESGSKETIYQKIFEEFPSKKVLVIGDRVAKDLQPAKKLGFTTALVQQGRGKFQKIHKEIVDFVIQDVTEVENLIKSLAN